MNTFTHSLIIFSNYNISANSVIYTREDLWTSLLVALDSHRSTVAHLTVIAYNKMYSPVRLNATLRVYTANQRALSYTYMLD